MTTLPTRTKNTTTETTTTRKRFVNLYAGDLVIASYDNIADYAIDPNGVLRLTLDNGDYIVFSGTYHFISLDITR